MRWGFTVDDASLFVPRTELEARFVALEARLGKVEKASSDMQAAQEALTATLHANSEKLDTIFVWVTKAGGYVGFLRRHGPKVAAFGMGIAISQGWITADNGRNFLHIFGL